MATNLSALAGIYAQAIQAGNRTVDSVPAVIKEQVTAILNTVDWRTPSEQTRYFSDERIA